MKREKEERAKERQAKVMNARNRRFGEAIRRELANDFPSAKMNVRDEIEYSVPEPGPGYFEKVLRQYDEEGSGAAVAVLKPTFSILGLLGKIFYGLFYALWWIVSFVFRLVYVIVARFGGPLLSAFKTIFSLASDSIKGIQTANPEQAQESEAEILAVFEPEPAPRRVLEETVAHVRIERDFGYGAKQAIVFCLVMAMLVAPLKALTYYKPTGLGEIKGKVLGVSEEGAKNFLEASHSLSDLDFQGAGNSFSRAGDNFLAAKKQLDEINGLLFVLAGLVPDKNIRMASEAKHILLAGKYASDLGDNFAKAMAALGADENKGKGIEASLDILISYAKTAHENSLKLKDELSAISINNVPEGYQDQFAGILNDANMLDKSLGEFIDLGGKAKEFLGATMDKRYLMIFQNNSELRATGGFIGSFAIVDFKKGFIKNMEVPGGGSYDTEAGLLEKVIAPGPLQLVNPLWHFWDANWWPDWPQSANKLEWFYEKSDGSTVDGVISLTPTVIEKVLRVIGPIDMTADYGAVIDADNFWTVTQRFAEQKPDVTKKPKKIIGDLMARMLAELPGRLNQNTIIGLLKAGQESLDEKQILLYFNDQALEDKVASYGWDGAIKKTDGDYLAVINTNIAGGKSDRKMVEDISHHATLAQDGSIVDDVTITRAHTGVKREEFSGVRNVDWMRIYVPEGSELLEASGFRQPDQSYFSNPEAGWKSDPDVYRTELLTRTDDLSLTKIYEESGHTVFANWSMVDPGETAVIRLKYRLPFKLVWPEKKDDFLTSMKTKLGLEKKDVLAYTLFIQKQAGAAASSFDTALDTGPGFKTEWKYPDNAVGDGTWRVGGALDKDKFLAVLYSKAE